MMADLIDTIDAPHPADARLAEDTRLSRRELAGTLSRIVELDSYIKEMTEERDALKADLRQALDDDREPIVDGEHGIVASLVERRKPATVDLVTFAKKPENEPLLAEAARMGLLNAALTPLRAQKGRSAAADALLRMEMPGGVSHVLSIQEVK